MKAVVEKANQQEAFFIDSAATSNYHDHEPADARMRQAAERRGIVLTSRSRQVTSVDFEKFDSILAMDHSNFRNLTAIAREHQSKVKLLSDFLGDEWPIEVPDPYYGGDDGFEFVLDMLEAACPKILSSFQS